MERKRVLWFGGVAALAVVLAGTGVAVASGVMGDDDEPPIEEPTLSEASRVALEHVGGGRVTETEVGDEESMYEVEVTLDDGSQVDVQLDEDLQVVESSVDGEGDDDGEGDEGDD